MAKPGNSRLFPGFSNHLIRDNFSHPFLLA